MPVQGHCPSCSQNMQWSDLLESVESISSWGPRKNIKQPCNKKKVIGANQGTKTCKDSTGLKRKRDEEERHTLLDLDFTANEDFCRDGLNEVDYYGENAMSLVAEDSRSFVPPSEPSNAILSSVDDHPLDSAPSNLIDLCTPPIKKSEFDGSIICIEDTLDARDVFQSKEVQNVNFSAQTIDPGRLGAARSVRTVSGEIPNSVKSTPRRTLEYLTNVVNLLTPSEGRQSPWHDQEETANEAAQVFCKDSEHEQIDHV